MPDHWPDPKGVQRPAGSSFWIIFKLQFLFALALSPLGLPAAESWTGALSQMPLAPGPAQISWSNAARLMLPALRSNETVKGLIFMPGATDEFFLYRRARANLTNPAPSLLDAVIALTNQTEVRATFRPPFLLLHTSWDLLEPRIVVEHQPTFEKLKRTHLVPQACFQDRDWNTLEPFLRRNLKLDIRPWPGAREGWHFYRPFYAAWNLDGFESLEAAALATKTKVTIRRNQALFQLQ